MEIYIDLNEEELKLEIEITYFDKGRPASISGLPEDSYPEEYPELEFKITEINDLDKDKSEFNFKKIEEKYGEEIETEIWKELEK